MAPFPRPSTSRCGWPRSTVPSTPSPWTSPGEFSGAPARRGRPRRARPGSGPGFLYPPRLAPPSPRRHVRPLRARRDLDGAVPPGHPGRRRRALRGGHRLSAGLQRLHHRDPVLLGGGDRRSTRGRRGRGRNRAGSRRRPALGRPDRVLRRSGEQRLGAVLPPGRRRVTGMRGLAGRVYLVAGAARGIGAAVATRLAHEGAEVILGDLDIDGARDTADRVRAGGGSAHAIAYDQADEASIAALVRQSVEHRGVLHGLHANAADISAPTMAADLDLLRMTPDTWQRVLRVNLIGYALLIRETLPHLLVNDAGGA